MELQRKKLKAVTKRSFVIDDAIKSFVDKTSPLQGLDLDLEGDDHSDNKKFLKNLIEQDGALLYLKTAEAAATAKRKREHQEKQGEEKERKVIDEMTKRTPEDLFNSAVQQKVEEVLKKNKKNHPVSR